MARELGYSDRWVKLLMTIAMSIFVLVGCIYKEDNISDFIDVIKIDT